LPNVDHVLKGSKNEAQVKTNDSLIDERKGIRTNIKPATYDRTGS